jgi:antitoxin FitA
MASLTIRDLDDSLKQDLRLRAARHSRSMEEEVRQILRSVLQGSPPAEGNDLATRIRARMADLGGIELDIAPREPPRDPSLLFVDFDVPPKKRSASAHKSKTGGSPTSTRKNTRASTRVSSK